MQNMTKIIITRLSPAVGREYPRIGFKAEGDGPNLALADCDGSDTVPVSEAIYAAALQQFFGGNQKTMFAELAYSTSCCCCDRKVVTGVKSVTLTDPSLPNV